MGSEEPKILIVDDSDDFCDLAKDALRQAGLHQVVEAHTVADALATLTSDAVEHQASTFDLILLDFELPDLDGVEACRRIKADDRWHDLPILMVTADDEPEILAEAFSAGAMDYLTKPVDRIAFQARVRSALRLKHEIDERRSRERQLLELTRQLEEANQELHQLAEIDPLTELANRRKFDLALDREWRRCTRERRYLALILADIDHFKHYNDRYGHQLGDVCLQRMASVLDKVARRPGDLACRWGGEKFALILPGVNNIQGPVMAEYLRRQVEQLAIEHLDAGPSRRLTVSLGVAAVRPRSSSSPEDLVAAADKALYRAKEEGRNRVESAPVDGRS